jgi:hypothetical protein
MKRRSRRTSGNSHHSHGAGDHIQRRLQFSGDGEEHRLAALFRAQEYPPASGIAADTVTAQLGNVADAQRRIAQRQDHGAGAEPPIGPRPMPSQALTIALTSAVEKGSTSFGLILRGDFMRLATFSAHHFRLRQKSQQFQFLPACDGLQPTTGAESIQVIRRQFTNGIDLPGFAECVEMVQRVSILPHSRVFESFALAMFEERHHRFAHILEHQIVRGFERHCFLAGAGHIPRTERLAHHPLTVDIAVRPERAVAFENVAPSCAMRTRLCVPPPRSSKWSRF